MLQFYTAAGVAALLLMATAYFAALKERNPTQKYAAILLPLVSAVLTFGTSYNAQMEANRSRDTLNARDSFYKLQLGRSIDSAKKIIDTLNTTLINSRSVIDSTNAILNTQKELDIKLNTEVKNTQIVLEQSKYILLRNNSVYRNTDILLTQLNRNLTALGDISIGFTITYDYRAPKFDSGQLNKINFALTFAKSRLRLDSVKNNIGSISQQSNFDYPFTGREVIFNDGRFSIITEIKGNDTTIVGLESMPGYTIDSKTEYGRALNLYSYYGIDIRSDINSKDSNSWQSPSDLILGPKENPNIYLASLNFKQNSLTLHVRYATKRQYNNYKIKGFIDLDSKYLILKSYVHGVINLKNFYFICGEDGSLSLLMDKLPGALIKGDQEFIYRFYHILNKNKIIGIQQ